MKREEIINKAIWDYSIENIHYGFEQIAYEFQDNSFQLLKGCLWEFDQIFKKVIERKKEKVCFVSIYFLYSSLQLDDYKLQVDFYDEQYLFDKCPVIGVVDFSFVLKYYRQELEYYTEYMKKHVIQVKYHEILKFRKMLQCKYKKVVKAVLEQYLPYIMNLKSFHEMDKCEDFHIVYGEYFSEGVFLYPIEQE